MWNDFINWNISIFTDLYLWSLCFTLFFGSWFRLIWDFIMTNFLNWFFFYIFTHLIFNLWCFIFKFINLFIHIIIDFLFRKLFNHIIYFFNVILLHFIINILLHLFITFEGNFFIHCLFLMTFLSYNKILLLFTVWVFSWWFCHLFLRLFDYFFDNRRLPNILIDETSSFISFQVYLSNHSFFWSINSAKP
jgi:hypothetical protein